jgi:prolyl 4-hydroxylase
MVRPYRPDQCRIREDQYRFGEQLVTVTMRVRNPTIVVLDNFMSRDECKELIALSEPNLQPSLEYVTKTDEVRVARAKGRVSETTFYKRYDESPLIQTIEQRLSILLCITRERGEGISVTRYPTGGFLHPHRDYLDLTGLPEDSPTRLGGWRVCTSLLYLNDVKEGGETRFEVPGIKIEPRVGRMVYFEYCNGEGQIDDDTLHEGLPVISGEKWIATKWYRQHVYTPIERAISETA